MADSAAPKPRLHEPKPDAVEGEPRRNFMVEFAAGAVGLFVGVVPLLAGLLVFLDPILRKKKGGGGPTSGKPMMRLATVDSVPEDGTPVRVPVVADKRDNWMVEPNQPIGAVYLRRLENGTVQCLNAICPHAGCYVDYLTKDREFLCPCHTSAFDLKGEKLNRPGKINPSPRPMDELKAEIRDGQEIWVEFLNFYTGQHEKQIKG